MINRSYYPIYHTRLRIKATILSTTLDWESKLLFYLPPSTENRSYYPIYHTRLRIEATILSTTLDWESKLLSYLPLTRLRIEATILSTTLDWESKLLYYLPHSTENRSYYPIYHTQTELVVIITPQSRPWYHILNYTNKTWQRTFINM
jgi:hypothetical protein